MQLQLFAETEYRIFIEKEYNYRMNIVLRCKNIWKNIALPARASIVYCIASFCQSGMAALTTPIFTRLLSTAEYGKYSVFNSWMGIFTCFVTLNIYGGVYTQDIVKNKDKRIELKKNYYILLTVLSIIWIIAFNLFHNLLIKHTGISYNNFILMLLMIWATGIFQIWSQTERIDYQYKSLLVCTIIYTILSTVMSIFLVYFAQDKVSARILGMTLPAIFVYGSLFIKDIRMNQVALDKKKWMHTLSLVIPLVPHYLSQIILNNSDRIMIEKMCGASSAGIYSLASSIAQIMSIFNTALLATIEPWVYKKMRDGKVKEIKNIAYPALILIAMLNWIFILMAPEIVSVFAPESYGEAIYVIPPISMSVFFVFSYSFFAFVEFYYEKTKYISIATVIGAIANIGLNYIFIRKFDYIAAGYTTLICYIVYAATHYLFMNKICRKEQIEKIYSLKILLIIASSFVGICMLTEMIYSLLIVRILIVVFITIILIIRRKEIVLLISKIKTERN